MILPDVAINLLAIFLPLLEILGIVTAIHAVMNGRTSQGAIAWAISLVTFPFLSLPLYWVFGRTKFSGYIEALRQGHNEHAEQVDEVLCRIREEFPSERVSDSKNLKVFEHLARTPFCSGNQLTLLIDGPATFKSMFQAIESARDYILIQFFIVKDDQLGRELKAHLIDKSREGVRIFFLYDEIGCHSLPGSYIQELTLTGVHMSAFKTTQGRGNRFQLNFRNHRKIAVIDGHTAFVGGHNVGDEYMGRNPKFGRWRDTHVKIEGPVARNVQMSFVEDWYWANRENHMLNWNARPSKQDSSDMLILPTGPADKMETCSLMFVHAIHMAKDRIWIASPYFVPNEAVLEALQIAALRGVDVRIMLPAKPDHRIVYLAGFYYIHRLAMPGISFWRYDAGFLHQKAFLVDDKLASVSTANADNRSFRLNFEISALTTDVKFIHQMEEMFEADFQNCREATDEDYLQRSWLFKLGVNLTRLLSPIL